MNNIIKHLNFLINQGVTIKSYLFEKKKTGGNFIFLCEICNDFGFDKQNGIKVKIIYSFISNSSERYMEKTWTFYVCEKHIDKLNFVLNNYIEL